MRRRGFTLVELLAVIVIIGILSVIVVPNVLKSLKDSKEKLFVTNTHGLYKAMENYIVKEQLTSPLVEVTGAYSNFCDGLEELDNYKTNNNYYIEFYGGKIIKISIKNENLIIDESSSEIKIDDISSEVLREYALTDNICETAQDVCPADSIDLKCKIINNNTVVADNTSSTYVTSASGIDFTSKSTLTNGQGLYKNSKLEDGKNKYFRGGSFCAYTDYVIEDSSGTKCIAAGGTWSSSKCSLDLNRATCQTQGFTYYDLKNNVRFAGHDWRIIRIDENNNIRMILADSTVSDINYGYDYDDNTHAGYMYASEGGTSIAQTHQNLNNNRIKIEVDSWYASNLASHTSKLSDAGYCNDRSVATGLGYGTTAATYGGYARNYDNSTANPKLSISSGCTNADRDLFTTSSSSIGNKKLTYPVGLITIDEARYAGVVITTNNFANYLKFSGPYWTMSPWHNIGGFLYISLVNSYGVISKEFPAYAPRKYVRASISLKPDTVVTSGTGTYDDPFVIQ